MACGSYKLYRKSDSHVAKGGVCLPNEILVRILQEIPPLELVPCRRVCHRFKSLVDGTPSLQYALECTLAGANPIPSKRFGLQVALENLRMWRESSIALDRTEDYELPYPDGTLTRRPGSNTVVARTCVAQIIPGRDILVTQLQSRYRGIPPKQWIVKPPEMTPLSFIEMDQSQDLLVIVQSSIVGNVLMGYELGTVTLSTGRPHPLGQRQAIRVAFTFPVFVDSQVRLCISDNHLGVVLFSNLRPMPHSEIWVWNWKTGELKLNAYAVTQVGRMIASSLVFLDGKHVLVPFWTSMPPLRDADEMHLRIFCYDPGDPTRRSYENIEAVAILNLPELGHRIGVLQLDGAGNPYSTQLPPASFDAPFDGSMRSRVFALNIVLTTNNDTRPLYYLLFAPMRLFQRCCDVRRFHIVNWDSWSGDARLIYKHPLGIVSDGHIFQTRALFPESRHTSDGAQPDNEHTPLVIYDFSSPELLRRDASLGRFRNCEYVFEPTALGNEQNAWKHSKIVTGEALPFRKIWTGFTLSLRRGMFSLVEDCLIIGDEDGTSWHVKQF
ncbi:uncharacterized protein PHACADRAFT_210040 [Phanerochaete carnosa HHB-10118-sp]|uniref:F-box domain-containing protein n=1 Tax=Phanerochaete carnosa (strain HHB-10118-sp) TaxID=650164 RepID=K5VRU4_PHACS|nr:uncharacterized protein PHACADRAFT_210040 [Phanerochaete carnosa HHB-10118-sp]EKM54223.1 hypothetical protein PHACADRAFT_210040 [Phanerochaete carnosa HHB-10118-sp]